MEVIDCNDLLEEVIKEEEEELKKEPGMKMIHLAPGAGLSKLLKKGEPGAIEMDHRFNKNPKGTQNVGERVHALSRAQS